MHLGNTGALFDGCTFNVKSESDTDGLWIGIASPCNLEFTSATVVGEFLGTGFVRPLFSAAGATPAIRFTGFTFDALDTATGLPTPTWSWGALNPQGYPAVRNARAPIATVNGATVTDATIAIPGLSGLGAVTERVMSDLGVTVTGGRLVYGITHATHPVGGVDHFTLIALETQSATAAGLFVIPLSGPRAYFISLTAVMRNAPVPPLLGWTVATLDLLITVDGAGVATVVFSTPTAVGGDTLFSLTPLVVPGPPDGLSFFVKASDALGGQTAEVDVEMRILAV
jgi:hypothetical protein